MGGSEAFPREILEKWLQHRPVHSVVSAGPVSVQSSKETTARQEAVLRGFSVETPVREAGEGGGRGREGCQTTAQAGLGHLREKEGVCSSHKGDGKSWDQSHPTEGLSGRHPCLAQPRAGGSRQGAWPQCPACAAWGGATGLVSYVPSRRWVGAGWPVPSPLAGTLSSSPSPTPLVTVQKYRLYVTFSPVCSCSYNLMR